MTVPSILRVVCSMYLLASLMATGIECELVPEVGATISWDEFKSLFNKTYESDEIELFKMATFKRNVEQIVEHNSLYDKGERSFRMSVNSFADQDGDDFRDGSSTGFSAAMLKDLRQRMNEGDPLVKLQVQLMKAHNMSLTLPDNVDRRRDGYVTPVKNQGQCGSCWAFASTGALEGQYYKKHRRLIHLSEQNLVDCSSRYGNNGCSGGIMTAAFDFVRENGLTTEREYPYEAMDCKCRHRNSSTVITDLGSIMSPSGDEQSLKALVATYGPVAVAIDASANTFRLYNEGVYNDDSRCGNEDRFLNHAVLVVGYGTDKKLGDYWIVKNSWGTQWGDKGYVKIARNSNNLCGIASFAVLPIV